MAREKNHARGVQMQLVCWNQDAVLVNMLGCSNCVWYCVILIQDSSTYARHKKYQGIRSNIYAVGLVAFFSIGV